VVVTGNPITKGGLTTMLHAGLDLSRRRLDVHLLAEDGSTLEVTTAPPDRDGLRSLVRCVTRDHGNEDVLAVIESMNGARFVHSAFGGLGRGAGGRETRGRRRR